MSSIKILRSANVPNLLRGFSLIEVLIALIIMSVGMLGIAGLYVHGMQAGRTSMFRHHAVTLAGDVADRIRANPLGSAEYTGGGANNNCVGGGINCTAAEMAGNDIDLWLQQAAATLPDGDVDVTYVAGVPAEYTVTVSWSEPGQDDPPPQYSIAFPVFEM